LWEFVSDQINASFGNPYGLKLAAIITVFEKFGVTDIKWQIQKMKVIFSQLMKANTKEKINKDE
jgi:hypothetical protein